MKDYQAAELEIRPDDRVAVARGRALVLSVRELGVLCALARAEGRVLTREELYTLVWGGRMRSSDRSVDVYVHKVRAKLADALPEWRFIHTHFGLGYRFGAERAGVTHDRPQAAADGAFTAFSQTDHKAVTGSRVSP